MHVEPDIIATLRFHPSDQGGRDSPTPVDKLGCIFAVDGHNFDCFILIPESGPIRPGDSVSAGLKFLNPDLIKHRLRVGQDFVLQDYRTFAVGTIESIH